MDVLVSEIFYRLQCLVFLASFSPQDLQLSLEEQEGRVAQLAATLEEERQASARLSQRAEEERLGLHRRLQELQVRLETEQAKALEMSAALGRERELRRSGLSSELEEDEAGQEVDGRLLDKLQRELDDKQAQVRLRSVSFKTRLSEEPKPSSSHQLSPVGGEPPQSAGGPEAGGGSKRGGAKHGPPEAQTGAGGAQGGSGPAGGAGSANV